MNRFYNQENIQEIGFRLSGNSKSLNEHLKERAEQQVSEFIQKNNHLFKTANIDVNIKRTNRKVHGLPEYECKINLIGSTGNFYAKDKGFGITKAVQETLEGIQEQVYKKKAKLFQKPSFRDWYEEQKEEET